MKLQLLLAQEESDPIQYEVWKSSKDLYFTTLENDGNNWVAAWRLREFGDDGPLLVDAAPFTQPPELPAGHRWPFHTTFTDLRISAILRRLPMKCGCGSRDDVRETFVSDDSRELPDLDSLPENYCAKCRADMISWGWNLVVSHDGILPKEVSDA